MKIHRAGYPVILKALIILLVINAIVYFFGQVSLALYISAIASGLVLLFVLRFFRCPNRKQPQLADGQVLCPADGVIVAIEEVDEPNIVVGKRTQVSIFMSCWNVHINWLPVAGQIKQVLHFDGKFTRAITPKSSDLNEHTAVVIIPPKGETVMVKQIAGAVARRILTYIKQDDQCKAGDEMGFIRFGSRVDVLLPLDYKICVEIGQKVVGRKTLIAIQK
jgi:phosphatidylserine decarboxylase